MSTEIKIEQSNFSKVKLIEQNGGINVLKVVERK